MCGAPSFSTILHPKSVSHTFCYPSPFSDPPDCRPNCDLQQFSTVFSVGVVYKNPMKAEAIFLQHFDYWFKKLLLSQYFWLCLKNKIPGELRCHLSEKLYYRPSSTNSDHPEPRRNSQKGQWTATYAEACRLPVGTCQFSHLFSCTRLPFFSALPTTGWNSGCFESSPSAGPFGFLAFCAL